MEAVSDLALNETGAVGVSLTTEQPENCAIYEHFGYTRVGQVSVANALNTWGFFRPVAA